AEGVDEPGTSGAELAAGFGEASYGGGGSGGEGEGCEKEQQHSDRAQAYPPDHEPAPSIARLLRFRGRPPENPPGAIPSPALRLSKPLGHGKDASTRRP